MTLPWFVLWLNPIFFFGTLLLGIVVSVQAFRSYRRTGDPTMGYFAVGFVLVLVVSTIVDAVATLWVETIASFGPGPSSVILVSVFEGFLGFAGVCAIAYALYAKRQV